MHQAQTPQPAISGNNAPLHVAGGEVQPFVGKHRISPNRGLTDADLDSGVDFFAWHGAMTRAKREATLG